MNKLPSIETSIPLVEEILGEYKAQMSKAYMGYRNHVYRMLHFCFALHRVEGDERKKFIIAACFHDLGLFTHDTLDYLPPSRELAAEYLKDKKKEDWVEEVGLMIDMHHKITEYDGRYRLVEIFRKADLAGFSLGLFKGEIPGEFVYEVKEAFANAGFHKFLLQFGTQWFFKHPFNPLPIFKW